MTETLDPLKQRSCAPWQKKLIKKGLLNPDGSPVVKVSEPTQVTGKRRYQKRSRKINHRTGKHKTVPKWKQGPAKNARKKAVPWANKNYKPRSTVVREGYEKPKVFQPKLRRKHVKHHDKEYFDTDSREIRPLRMKRGARRKYSFKNDALNGFVKKWARGNVSRITQVIRQGQEDVPKRTRKRWPVVQYSGIVYLLKHQLNGTKEFKTMDDIKVALDEAGFELTTLTELEDMYAYNRAKGLSPKDAILMAAPKSVIPESAYKMAMGYERSSRVARRKEFYKEEFKKGLKFGVEEVVANLQDLYGMALMNNNTKEARETLLKMAEIVGVIEGETKSRVKALPPGNSDLAVSEDASTSLQTIIDVVKSS